MLKDTHANPSEKIIEDDKKIGSSTTYQSNESKDAPFLWLQESNRMAHGEVALWVAVITQALMDALSRCKKPESQYQKHEAIRWLTGNSRDFIDVCLSAGMDPNYVRKKAKKAIYSPKSWRAEPGKGKRYLERKRYREKQKLKNKLLNQEDQQKIFPIY